VANDVVQLLAVCKLLNTVKGGHFSEQENGYRVLKISLPLGLSCTDFVKI